MIVYKETVITSTKTQTEVESIFCDRCGAEIKDGIAFRIELYPYKTGFVDEYELYEMGIVNYEYQADLCNSCNENVVSALESIGIKFKKYVVDRHH